jgi:hypothetical protein
MTLSYRIRLTSLIERIGQKPDLAISITPSVVEVIG